MDGVKYAKIKLIYAECVIEVINTVGETKKTLKIKVSLWWAILELN